MERFGKFGVVSLATALMWLGAFAVRALDDSGGVASLALLAAFGSTIVMWLVLAMDMVVDRLGKFGIVALSTVLIWFGVFAVRVLNVNDNLTSVAVLGAFGATLALWLVLGLEAIGQKAEKTPESWEKAKRGADEDARLALLLKMLDEDERWALKQRLMGDGEAIALSDLLAAEERAQRRRA